MMAGENEVEDWPSFDVDATIEKLLSVRTKVPGPSCLIELDIDTINAIISKVQQVVQSQPMLLRLKAPLTVGTDIHG